jgi:PEP-CTERM/exosortase A-associated glycosyltransferase
VWRSSIAGDGVKILHVLERSAPELVGYTVRGGYIVKHQRRLGLDPVVVTSPFFAGANGNAIDDIDGIRHYRSNHIPRPDKTQGRLAAYWTRMNMVRRYREFVVEVARREKPDVIHAHSSYVNGIAARYASKRLGIPFVYELRGLWADTAVVEDGLRHNSIKYRAFWQLELGVVRRADRIVAISRGIRNAIVERGIDPDKIAIVPNGVDTEVFAPRPVDRALEKRLGLTGCFVVGFIGSVRRLEGIELAIEAFKEVHSREPRARLVIVGDGPERQRLEAAAADGGLGDVVRFTGLVPHDQILQYYSVMDVLVYPRIDAFINQTVTPLKPLEAMAMGKVCLASDVGGLKELVDDGITGLLFAAGDVRDATGKMLLLASDRTLRDRLSAQAQVAVRRDREWSTIASRYADIYRRAGAREMRQFVGTPSVHRWQEP